MHTNLNDEIHHVPRKKLIKHIEREHGIEAQNNLLVGIVMGITIMICLGILLFTSFVEAVMY